MKIACLGWGSLIWNSQALPIQKNWFNDGPLLPIEFARHSQDDCITLAVVPGVRDVRSLWTFMMVPDLDTAKIKLAEYEGIKTEDIPTYIGSVSSTEPSNEQLAERIRIWASSIDLDAVVWTNLPPQFQNKTQVPTVEEVIAFLQTLPPETKKRAEEYVRKTPRQIDTEYRQRIEEKLGWTPIPEIASFLTDEKYQNAVLPLRPQPARYRTALAYTSSNVLLPVALVIITATLYVLGTSWGTILGIPTNVLILVVGLLCTAGFWLFISLLFMPFARFDTANARSSNHLRRHVLALQSGLKLLSERIDSSGKTDGEGEALRTFRDATARDYDLAINSVYEYLVAIHELVGKAGNLSWIVGDGYIAAWNFVHQAEEAMLVIAPRGYVIREALHDEAAIDGSALANRDSILRNIQIAVRTLSRSAGAYLKSRPVQDQTTDPGDSAAVDNSSVQDGTLDPVIESEARNALRDARQVLNEFRASLWEGLVNIRNQMVSTALITALFTYILLCVVISANVNVDSMKAALIFYLVGAIVGLFGRLHIESQSDHATDDYGLTKARVMVVPFLSGLAAVGGVLVIAYLSHDILSNPGINVSSAILPRMQDVYDLVQNPSGIVIAALFGLSPNLIINLLQQKAEDTTAKLRNSSAPNQGNS